MDRIVAGMDKAVSKELQKVLKKQKIKFLTYHKVTSVETVGDEVVIKANDKKDKPIRKRDVEYLKKG